MAIPFFSNLRKKKPYEQAAFDRTAQEGLTEQPTALPVDEQRIAKWNNVLKSYKNRRATVEQKILSNEAFLSVNTAMFSSMVYSPALAIDFTL